MFVNREGSEAATASTNGGPPGGRGPFSSKGQLPTKGLCGEAERPLDVVRPERERQRLSALCASSDMSAEELALAQAYRMLQFVDMSRTLFPTMRDLADHPGWEIMLQIFVASREGRTVTTADLCDLTGCWRPLTARYVDLMVERDLVDRSLAVGNPDILPLRLTPEAEKRFQDLLCGFARGWLELHKG